jgi:hypothetical protein
MAPREQERADDQDLTYVRTTNIWRTAHVCIIYNICEYDSAGKKRRAWCVAADAATIAHSCLPLPTLMFPTHCGGYFKRVGLPSIYFSLLKSRAVTAQKASIDPTIRSLFHARIFGLPDYFAGGGGTTVLLRGDSVVCSATVQCRETHLLPEHSTRPRLGPR